MNRSKGFWLLWTIWLCYGWSAGSVPEDRDVMRLAKASGKPMTVVVNKVDSERDAEWMKAEFYEFGEDVLHCSFEKLDHTDKLVEAIIQNIPEAQLTESTGVRLAIVGKPMPEELFILMPFWPEENVDLGCGLYNGGSC